MQAFLAVGPLCSSSAWSRATKLLKLQIEGLLDDKSKPFFWVVRVKNVLEVVPTVFQAPIVEIFHNALAVVNFRGRHFVKERGQKVPWLAQLRDDDSRSWFSLYPPFLWRPISSLQSGECFAFGYHGFSKSKALFTISRNTT